MSTTQQAYDFLAPPSQDDDLGMLGSYRIISEIGKGGMGYVFRAEDTRLKRTVALKVMNKKIAATPNSRKRFLEEARSMAAVHHDNVVVIFEVGEKSGTPFMAMELLKGRTVEALNAEKKQLSYEQILDFAIQISRGLAAAHEKGIVHRDIKPANIWVVENTDRIKILDFGLALAQTPVDRLAGIGSVIGTPGYLSPEQARTDPLDDRSDLYSLGVVLYEMCTGQLPLQAPTIAGQLVAILAHKPKPIRELNPDIPAPLANLVHRLLAKESRDRPSSAVVLEDLLREAAVQCEAKSEVALAINKLQQGLSEAVNKKSNGAFEIAPDGMPAAVENPLDFTAFSPSTTAAPLALPSSAARPIPARTQPAKKADAEENVLLRYWPFLAIAAVALLLLTSIVIYTISGSGGTQASQDTTPMLVPQNNAEPNSSAKVVNAPAPRATREIGDTGKTREIDEALQSAAKVPVETKPELSADPMLGPVMDPTPEPSLADDNAIDPSMPATAIVDSPSQTTAVDPPDSAALQEPEMLETPQLEPEEAEQHLTEISVTIFDGIGADATVSRSNPNEPLGKAHDISVRMRKRVELEHAYLRFDLSSIGVPRDKIKNAELVLTLAGEELPVRSLLRMYGTTAKGTELWRESGRAAIYWNKCFSKVGLEQLEEIAEIRFSGDSAGVDSPIQDRQVRIGGEKLAQFLSNTKTDSVNLVLSGGQANNNPLRFLSHEGDSINGPTLVLFVDQP